MDAQRFPLTWPHRWPRTPAIERRPARFHGTTTKSTQGTDGSTASYRQRRDLSAFEATRRLQVELERLGAEQEILSTNLRLRLDGTPRSDQREPEDPGAAVYFRLHGKPRALACDRWTRVADNIAAVAAHIEAIRAVDRYGVGTLDQAFAGYAALPPTGADWRIVLHLEQRTVSADDVEAQYRRLARTAHPDVGGSHEDMARLNAARTAALLELGA